MAGVNRMNGRAAGLPLDARWLDEPTPPSEARPKSQNQSRFRLWVARESEMKAAGRPALGRVRKPRDEICRLQPSRAPH